MLREDIKEIKNTVNRLDEKLDVHTERITVLETKEQANKTWVLWLWGGLVTIANFIFSWATK